MRKGSRAVPTIGKPRPSGPGSAMKPAMKQGPKRKLPQPAASTKPAKTSPHEDVHNDSGGLSLVRYINETMIKKMAGKTELRDITSLNLTLTTKDDGKKIRYIENLEGLTNLRTLVLSHNQISKIERLQHLTRLRELDLSCNRIGRLDGLETLAQLQRLDLSHNLIEAVPSWLAKRLKALRALHLAGNLLYSLSDVFRLRPLKDLVELSIAGNALCDLPHHRLYALFHLRTLQVLDRRPVTEAERQEASQRFEQEEVENLEVQLGEEERKLRNLQEDHERTVTEQKQSKSLVDSLKSKNLEHQHTILQLRGELQAQDNLLKRKTAELNKACRKQFSLEQELAFQKIDAKFEPLEFRNDSMETEGGTEESPYIGKAGYKRNRLAHESHTRTPKSRTGRAGATPHGQDVSPTIVVSPQTQGQLDSLLQDRLTDKQRQIATAQDHLSRLQNKIEEAEKSLDDKKAEMHQISANPSRRPLSETEKKELQRRLWERLEAVKDLRQRVGELESAMGETLDIIQEREQEMQRLRRQRPRSGHPGHAEAGTEIANVEQQTADAGDKYRELQQELEEVVDLLAKEMEKMDRVKEQVAKDKVDLNDELRGELEDVTAGLTAYMRESQLKVVQQESQNAALRRERDALLERLRRAEAHQREPDTRGRRDFLHDFEDMEELQTKLEAAEEALAAAKAEKDKLRNSLRAETLEQQEAQEERLRAAAEEAKNLNSALQRQKKQAKAETDALKRQLDAQRRQVEHLRQSADQSHDPEELDHLTNQLHELQAERDDLEDRLRELQEQSREALDASLRPDEVLVRVEQLRRHLEQGRGKMRPLDRGDALGQSLAEVEETVRGKLRDTAAERQAARRQQQKAEREADALREQVAVLQEQLDQAERERLRNQANSPDFSKEDMVDGRGRDGRDTADGTEEDAVINAMRAEVRRLQEKLRQRPVIKTASHQVAGRLVPEQDPHTLAELQQLEAALQDTQQQMRDNDQMAANELARAETEARDLREELSRQLQQTRDGQRAREREREEERQTAARQTQQALAQAESEARCRARQAAQELARARNQMGGLQQALADREARLQAEMQRGDLASHTIADQQDEIGALYSTLEEQKAEMLKLQEALDRLLAPQSGMQGPLGGEGYLDHLLSEIEHLQHALHQQRRYLAHPAGHVISAPPPPSDLRPGTGVGLSTGLPRPVSYQYTPMPPPTHHLPPGGPVSSDSRTFPRGTTSALDSRVSRGGASLNGYPQPGGESGFQTAVPNPQGVGPLPASFAQGNLPAGNGRAAPVMYHPQPVGQGTAQATVPAQPMAPLVNGYPPVGAAASQQSGAWTQQGGVSRGDQAGTVLPPSTGTTQWPGNAQGPYGASGVAQNAFVTALGVAPPATISQPIMAPVLVGATPGGPTPGIVLGAAFPPLQPQVRTATKGRSGDGGDDGDSPTGNGTVDTSTDEPDSAVPPEGGKPSRTIVLPPGGLFCNVPEHHDMEDEIARLRKLLADCRKSKKRRADSELEEMESTLKDRRGELEGLEVAVQRQHGILRTLHEAEADLQRKRDEAAVQLRELSTNIDRRTRRQDFLEGRGAITPEEADYERLEATMDQDYMEEELGSLERALRKRRAELRVADSLLHECQADLKEATDTARSTLEKYDHATADLQRAQEDREEIERRSAQTALDLIKAQEHLATVQEAVDRLDAEHEGRQGQARAADEVLAEKERVVAGLDARTEQATDRLQKLQTDLLLVEESITEKQETARQQSQLLADRRADLQRLDEQVEVEKVRLANLDQEIGRRQSELQGLTSDLETNQRELVVALREAEHELVSLKHKVKETKASRDDLLQQRQDLESAVADQRGALGRRQQETEQEERSLQDRQARLAKTQTELKHTLEMVQLEKTELEALRLQHETRMADLEKTQLIALQERAELESVQVSCQEKRGELERTSKQLGLARMEKERLTAETAALESRAATLHREEEALEDQCRQWDNKVAQLMRKHDDLLEARKAEESRLKELEQSMGTGQEDLGKIDSKRALLTTQMNAQKQQVKETAKELRLAKEELKSLKNHRQLMQQEFQEQERQKSEARGDLAELRAAVERTQEALGRAAVEERDNQEALHRLRQQVEERHQEAEDGQLHVEQVQADVEQEESRLSRMIGGLTTEAERLRSEVGAKRLEVEAAQLRLLEMRSQQDQLEQRRQTVAELQGQIAQLESEVKERVVEKTSLAETVNFSHVEINSLRKEKESLEKRLSEMTSQLESSKEHYRQAKQRFKARQRELEREIEEANLAANQHCTKADRLSLRLKEVTEQYLQHQSQSSRELKEEKRAKAEALEKLRDLSRKGEQEEVASIGGISDLEEVDDLQQQKMDLTRQLVELQSNIQQARLDASLIRDGDFLDELTAADESRWRQDQAKSTMQAEQDRLKLQIHQRVSSQASVLDSVKDRATSSLVSLKRKLSNLEGLVANNSSLTRSLTSQQDVSLDGEASVNQRGFMRPDHLPQRDTAPSKMVTKDPGLTSILKPSSHQPAIRTYEGLGDSPPSPGPSHAYSSQRHRRTLPTRPEEPTQRQRVTGSDRHRYDDFMESLQRLKEEKLAQIERSSRTPAKPTR